MENEMYAVKAKIAEIYDAAKSRRACTLVFKAYSHRRNSGKTRKTVLEFELRTTQLQTKEMQINLTY
jgi:hypothetical protein